MSEPWKHHAKVVNGFRMHYVIAGSGYPLVFLHGWPQSWYEWRKIIPALAEKFTVIAPDLRGLGDSELRRYADQSSAGRAARALPPRPDNGNVV